MVSFANLSSFATRNQCPTGWTVLCALFYFILDAPLTSLTELLAFHITLIIFITLINIFIALLVPWKKESSTSAPHASEVHFVPSEVHFVPRPRVRLLAAHTVAAKSVLTPQITSPCCPWLSKKCVTDAKLLSATHRL
jgi:hypothetical protein